MRDTGSAKQVVSNWPLRPQARAMVCREHGVEVFFEDDSAVLAHVDEATVCMRPFNADGDDLSWATRQAI